MQFLKFTLCDPKAPSEVEVAEVKSETVERVFQAGTRQKLVHEGSGEKEYLQLLGGRKEVLEVG